LSSKDSPAVSNAPLGSKALARVLSAIPQEEYKENSLGSSSECLEPEQSADKNSSSIQPNTLANCTSDGKIQHCHIHILCECEREREIERIKYLS